MASVLASRRSASRLMAAICKGQSRAASSFQSQPRNTVDRLAEEQHKKSMAQHMKREWKVGDLYAPHDLSAAEMRKWSKKHQPTRDVFDVLSIDPLSLYKNFSVMSDFISDMGRIRPAKETGLRPVNQRKVAKAVRRAVALGLMPSVHKHPELIKMNREKSGRMR